MPKKHKHTSYPEVQVIDVADKESIPIKGHKFFPSPMFPRNISIVAPTSGGKTQLMQSALFATIAKGITECVFIFCATARSDSLWIEIIKRLQKITRVVVFDGFHDEKVSNLDAAVQQMMQQVEVSKADLGKEDEKEQNGAGKPGPVILFNNQILKPEQQGAGNKDKKPPKPKFRAPRFVCIADDVSASELRSKELYTALKHARHYQSQWYLISQSFVATLPMIISQLQWICIGGGFSSKQLKALSEKFSLGFDFDVLDAMYYMVTREKFHFLCIDLKKNLLYNNFTPIDKKYIPEE